VVVRRLVERARDRGVVTVQKDDAGRVTEAAGDAGHRRGGRRATDRDDRRTGGAKGGDERGIGAIRDEDTGDAGPPDAVGDDVRDRQGALT